MAVRIVIVAPGLRDPFWDENHDPRSYDGADKKGAFRRFLEEATQAIHGSDAPVVEVLEDRCHVFPGAVLTSAHLLAGMGWAPQKIVLVFVPDEDLNPRVQALQSILPRMIPFSDGCAPEVVLLPLESADVAELDSVIASLRDAMRSEDFNFMRREEAEVRVVIGPATLGLNIGLFMLPYEFLPGAQLYQALHPVDVNRSKPKLSSVPRTYLKKLPIGEAGLPHLSVEGQAPADIRKLKQQIASLQAKIDTLEGSKSEHAERANGVAEQSVSTWKELDERQKGEQRDFLQRAILEEKRLASEQGRAPERTRAARIAGMNRQNFDNALKRLGLSWQPAPAQEDLRERPPPAQVNP